MEVRSLAKINWALRVTGKRADGFHDIETLFQTISLHDTLTFRTAERLSLTCAELPVDETNLVIRAARALGSPPVAITLQKRIPVGGGLGGGSSNAAATLVTLAKMFDIRKPLHDVALALGSDVPFFLQGGTAYASGRGEMLTPLPHVTSVPLLLLMPQERVLTSEAYAMLRRFSPPLGAQRYRAMIEDDLLGHASELVNDFEETIFAKVPQLGRLKRRMIEAGAAWAGMSGSGSTIVGAFRAVPDRDAALGRFDDVRAIAAETM
jgi:4-diphosphocytidyl-2-C-methyl-D-erythritol kinase